jgi:hypothetical protein
MQLGIWVGFLKQPAQQAGHPIHSPHLPELRRDRLKISSINCRFKKFNSIFLEMIRVRPLESMIRCGGVNWPWQ